MTKRKNGTRILIVAVLICALAAGSVYAFLISRDATVNEFSVGYNESHIEEVFGDYDKFEAGKDYEKKVSVVNDGNVDCYVRVFAEIEDPDVAAVIDVDYNSTDWTAKQDDGYYYYKAPLKTGESTVPLFTTLSVNKEVNDFQMIVYSETVQAHGIDDPIEAFAQIN